MFVQQAASGAPGVGQCMAAPMAPAVFAESRRGSARETWKPERCGFLVRILLDRAPPQIGSGLEKQRPTDAVNRLGVPEEYD